MTDESHPIAYTALLPGTSVQTRDGQEFGRVERVLVDDKVDVFDGIVVGTADGSRFVDADQIGQIFTSHVCTTVSAEDVLRLPVPDHDPARRGDSPAAGGSSFGERLGRMFGRGKST
jgi:sporulation protein YlmC with PRC-barrel domain